MKENRKRQDAEHGLQFRDFVELGHKRRRQEESGVQHKRKHYTYVEHSVEVVLRSIPLLHKGASEPAVNENVAKRNHDRQKRNRAVVVGSQEPG